MVGTPGRIIDCLESRYLGLSQCDYVVLDEADTMIDMGFEEQVESVLSALNAKDSVERTTVMFSATMPRSVEALAKRYMRNPVTIRVGDKDTSKNQNIKQEVIMCSEKQKMAKLESLLRSISGPTIVFVNTKGASKSVCSFIESLGIRATELHSGKMQSIREENLKSFKENRVDVLVATDVASRGLDIIDVTHVINFDMASTIERYTHRIGRTGRAGKSGLATTLLTERDTDVYEELYKYLVSTNNQVPAQLERHEKVRPSSLQRKILL